MTVSSDSCFKFSKGWSMLSAVVNIALSSAKLKRSDNFNIESGSLRNLLNNIGHNMDSFGTPDINVRKSLKKMLTFTFGLLRLRYK